jgi:hypothetical protein
MTKTPRKPLAAALLALMFATAAAPALAADRPGLGFSITPSRLVEQAQVWLAGLLGWGGGAPTSAVRSASGEAGVMIDPNGQHVAGTTGSTTDPASTSTANTDVSVEIDPDGAH